MIAVEGPAPGFRRYPDHHIRIHRATGKWRALDGQHLLAESDSARILEESGHGAVIYFPSRDVCKENLARSDSDTSCPFKGRARYFRSAAKPDGPDIAWTYPATYDEVADITGFVAFYANRIQLQNDKLQSETEN